jgi:hypothetical protein
MQAEQLFILTVREAEGKTPSFGSNKPSLASQAPSPKLESLT